VIGLGNYLTYRKIFQPAFFEQNLFNRSGLM
jgi:hypothetical protein